VRYENRYFQLERTTDYPPRQAKVTVCEWEAGRIEVRYQGKARPHREIAAPEPAEVKIDKKTPPKPSSWKPAANHPWRKRGLGLSSGAVPLRPPQDSYGQRGTAVKALR